MTCNTPLTTSRQQVDLINTHIYTHSHLYRERERESDVKKRASCKQMRGRRQSECRERGREEGANEKKRRKSNVRNELMRE